MSKNKHNYVTIFSKEYVSVEEAVRRAYLGLPWHPQTLSFEELLMNSSVRVTKPAEFLVWEYQSDFIKEFSVKHKVLFWVTEKLGMKYKKVENSYPFTDTQNFAVIIEWTA